MSEWKIFSLGEVCVINANSYSKNDNWTFVNYLDTGNITANKIESIQHINILEEKLPSRAKRKVKTDSIIYSTVRPNQRHYGIIKSQPKNFLVSTGFAVIDVNPEIVDANFLYYRLTQNEIVQHLQSIAEQSTTAYPSIRPIDIGNLKFELPPLATQKKIAAVLSALDDKIELDNAINKNLEEQAQAIFKNMFVDNFNPAWKNGTLSDIAEFKSGKRPLNKFEKESEAAFVPIFGASSIMGYTSNVLSNEKILITGRVGTHGIIQRYNKPCWVSDNAFIITSNYYEYIFQILHRINYNNLNRGSTQPLLTQKDLKNFVTIIPDEKILTKFENVVGDLMSMHDENIFENKKLGELRDTLLPRLMSGEIDVSKVEI